MNKENIRYEILPKPELEDIKEVIPDTEDFEEPEKAKALIQNLNLCVGDTIKEFRGGEFIINPRMVLRGHSPKDYEKEIKLFKDLCTPLMIKHMTKQIKLKKKFEDKQRDKFYYSFCKKLDNRLKLKSLKESEAVIYFTQENSFKNCVAGLHNCVHHLLDIEREINEFKLSWFNEKIPNTQEWREESDGEYMVLTDSEADDKADDYLDIDLWKGSVEGGNTTSSFEDWKEDVISIDGRGHLLNGYDGMEEKETINGTDYFIYRTN